MNNKKETDWNEFYNEDNLLLKIYKDVSEKVLYYFKIVFI